MMLDYVKHNMIREKVYDSEAEFYNDVVLRYRHIIVFVNKRFFYLLSGLIVFFIIFGILMYGNHMVMFNKSMLSGSISDTKHAEYLINWIYSEITLKPIWQYIDYKNKCIDKEKLNNVVDSDSMFINANREYIIPSTTIVLKKVDINNVRCKDKSKVIIDPLLAICKRDYISPYILARISQYLLQTKNINLNNDISAKRAYSILSTMKTRYHISAAMSDMYNVLYIYAFIFYACSINLIKGDMITKYNLL